MSSPSVSNWSGRDPRRCQVEAFAAYVAGRDAGVLSGGVFAAATGSGKSILLAEVVADLLSGLTDPADVVLVTTPTIALVEQLSATLRHRVGESVGVFYTRGKDTSQRLIVTCHPSFDECLQRLAAAGRRVAVWCADECHRTDNPQILKPAEQIADVPRIGWSATPYKSDPDPSKGLTLWLHELHRYSIDDALADGVLVPWRASGLGAHDAALVNALADRAAKAKDADAREGYARQQVEIIDAASIRWVQQQRGPGVVSAHNVVDAEAFALRLSDLGVRALAIHANQSAAIRRARLDALEAGELDCLVHVQILVEGVDLPWLRWGCLRRSRNRVGFVQEVGRFLRAFPGKVAADLFDPCGLFVQHGISHPSQLAGEADLLLDEADDEVLPVDTVDVLDPLTGKTYRVPRESKARTPVQTIAIAHAVSTSFISEAVASLRASGLVPLPQSEGGQWRLQPASAPQLVRLEQGAKRYAMLKRRPEPVAKAIAHAYDLLLDEHLSTFTQKQPTTLRKGVLSDFISLDAMLKPGRPDASGQFDFTSQNACLAALSRCPLDGAAVVDAAKDAAKARKVL